MSLGVAFLHRDHQARYFAGVFADTRVTVGEFSLDRYAKTYEIDQKTVAVCAGHVTPVTVAIEAARSLLSTTVDRNGSPSHLWKVACVVAYFLRENFREFDEHRSQGCETSRCEVALLGEYSNGEAGLAWMAFASGDQRPTVKFARPDAGEYVQVVVGHARLKGMLELAGLGDDTGRLEPDDLASALWYVIQTKFPDADPGNPETDAFKSVGGGLCVGLRPPANARIVWPLVEVQGQLFYRGLPVPEPGPDVGIGRWSPKISQTRAEQLDRLHAEYVAGGREVPGNRRPDLEIPVEDLVAGAPYTVGGEPTELTSVWVR